MMEPSPLPIGEIAALASAACWAVASILWTRQMSVSPPIAMNLFKTGFCLPLFVITLLLAGRDGPLAGVGGASVGILLISGVIGMSIGDTLYFAGLARIGAQPHLVTLTKERLHGRLGTHIYPRLHDLLVQRSGQRWRGPRSDSVLPLAPALACKAQDAALPVDSSAPKRGRQQHQSPPTLPLHVAMTYLPPKVDVL